MAAVEGAVGTKKPDSSLLSLSHFAGLPLKPPGGGTKLGLAGRGGPVLLELLLLSGGWNELDRKMPSETGRGLRAVGGGCGLLWLAETVAGRSPYDFRVAVSLAPPPPTIPALVVSLPSSSSSSSPA